MGCSSCGSGSVGGCGNKGQCSSGSCNRMNSYDWISVLDINDPTEYEYVEISFKKGARKEIAHKKNTDYSIVTGDMVLVDVQGGYDIGRISLSGELVRLQMKKKNITEDKSIGNVMRRANDHDLDKLEQLRSKEKDALVKARVIARTLGLDMKMGDVEYRGDGKKATFYYTANGRVDFRELVKAYAKEFKVKIEMRQIGSRQESARIGGIGACGRELCCSTWLSDFKSVNTNAARYQNISINQTKLSGQCGRLKCCLNYELDTYLDALDSFPKDPEVLKTQKGNANLVKMDIFKGLLYYSYENPKFKGQLITLSKEQVAEILKQNKKNHIPEELVDISFIEEAEPKEAGEGEIDLIDTFEEIVLPNQRKKRRNSRSNKNRPNSNNPENRQKQDRPQRKSGQNQNNKSKQTNKSQESNKPQDKTQSPENKTGGTQNRESSNNQNRPSKKPRNKNQRNNRNNQQNRQKPNNDENK
ncbi:MAG TPA: regulatory iron-sulfur-containing complex subunit RicT [Saprospiraceae bacterium]|nr:hypothetical protein [Saprospiraceae bacterium]MCB9327077.1 hypothetical protein [Lewinellaceae bacterium]HRX28064.1 regulatory iron-sulfur-containing complex subunit RicT [Saprospiraceae bacterium]